MSGNLNRTTGERSTFAPKGLIDMLRPEISRRSFLKGAAPFAIGLRAIARGQVPIERGRFSESDIPLAREELLKQVNAERALSHLSQLQLDELGCQVAGQHALDMAKGEFLSHWGSDGRKPYHRYSFAGGTDVVQENVSSADGIHSVTPSGVLKDLHDMHRSMLEEVPPNDGHRKTILYPNHTHVGFGIALEGRSIRLDELYLAKYVSIEPLARELPVKSSVILKGKLLYPADLLNGVEVYYEPFPTPPDIGWLRQPRSYGMPGVIQRLYPRLPVFLTYPDGTHGSIDIDSANKFRVRVPLSRVPGVNTLMVWIKAGRGAVAFPAAQICIRVV